MTGMIPFSSFTCSRSFIWPRYVCERYLVFCRFELFNLKDRYVYVRRFYSSFRREGAKEREREFYYIVLSFSNGLQCFFFLSFEEVDFILINEHFFKTFNNFLKRRIELRATF